MTQSFRLARVARADQLMPVVYRPPCSSDIAAKHELTAILGARTYIAQFNIGRRMMGHDMSVAQICEALECDAYDFARWTQILRSLIQGGRRRQRKVLAGLDMVMRMISSGTALGRAVATRP